MSLNNIGYTYQDNLGPYLQADNQHSKATLIALRKLLVLGVRGTPAPL